MSDTDFDVEKWMSDAMEKAKNMDMDFKEKIAMIPTDMLTAVDLVWKADQIDDHEGGEVYPALGNMFRSGRMDVVEPWHAKADAWRAEARQIQNRCKKLAQWAKVEVPYLLEDYAVTPRGETDA